MTESETESVLGEELLECLKNVLSSSSNRARRPLIINSAGRFVSDILRLPASPASIDDDLLLSGRAVVSASARFLCAATMETWEPETVVECQESPGWTGRDERDPSAGFSKKRKRSDQPQKGDKIEAAYARSAVLKKQHKLMDAWAAFCTSPPIAEG